MSAGTICPPFQDMADLSLPEFTMPPYSSLRVLFCLDLLTPPTIYFTSTPSSAHPATSLSTLPSSKSQGSQRCIKPKEFPAGKCIGTSAGRAGRESGDTCP